MAFDWLRTLDQSKVSYATSGKNVSKGNFVVHCPFCGPEDQGMHMSVALKGRGWRCFRKPDHRGQHPGRLLAALLQCSLEQAYRLVGDTIHVPDDFLGSVKAALADAPVSDGKAPRMPIHFKPLDIHKPSARPYCSYLDDRGFSRYQIEHLYKRYGIRYATSGAYNGRIIFPVRTEAGLLASWTGRHIGAHDIRYKSLSSDPEKAAAESSDPALGPISDYLLFHRQLLAALREGWGETLYLVEGPFDALKIMTLGRQHCALATCCFTATPSAAQINLLHELFPRFRRRVLLLDRGTLANSMRVMQTFASLGLEAKELDPGIKDPGELNQSQFDMLHFRSKGEKK